MADRGPDPRRVCEVIVARSGRPDTRGSGYRVAFGHALTVLHVVADAARVRLRFEADRDDEWETGASVVWRDADADLALLAMDRPHGDADFVAYGRLADRWTAPAGVAVGFPRFKLRDDPVARDGVVTRYRDSHQADGTIAALSNRRRGTLEFTVRSPPRDDLGSDHSPWEGISGAALWCDGVLVGVVVEHERAAGPGLLTAARIERLVESLSPDDRDRLGDMIGLGPGVERLEVVGEESAAGRRADGALRALPEPPDPYVAHPYTLLEGRLVGRRQELDELDAWITDPASPASPCPVYCVVAIGGMGKSAATWHWFTTSTSGLDGEDWAGRMWWSFYEAGATFERFVVAALAYVKGVDEATVMQLRAGERELALLEELRRRPFLLALDGLERALIAYADPGALNRAEEPGGTEGRDRLVRQSRRMADPHGDGFLRRLADTGRSRVLVSSRLLPQALETRAMTVIPGVHVRELEGLPRAGAAEVLAANGVHGGVEEMLDVLSLVEYHPLVTIALAAEVSTYRPAPGDFLVWDRDHADFDPAALELLQRTSHILEVALRGLEPRESDTMSVIAAFSSPAGFDQLSTILRERGTVADDAALSRALEELDDRGLIGWDRESNRYDMHPIIRGAALQRLRRESGDETDVYGSLRSYFEAQPPVESAAGWNDLLPIVELYRSTIRTGRLGDALTVYRDRLHEPLRALSLAFRVVELLEEFVTPGRPEVAGLERRDERAFVLNEIAIALDQIGEPGQAAGFFEEVVRLCRQDGQRENVVVSVCGLAGSQLAVGRVAEADENATAALVEARGLGRPDLEVLCLQTLGRALARSGRSWDAGRRGWFGRRTVGAGGRDDPNPAATCFRRAVALTERGRKRPGELAAARAFLVDHLHAQGRFGDAAGTLADAVADAEASDVESVRIWVERLRLAERLHDGDVAGAYDGGLRVLARAQEISDIEVEAATYLLLLRCLARDPTLGEQVPITDRLHDIARRGPFPFLTVDVLLHEARTSLREGATGEAADRARRALRLSWPDEDGPFGYRAGRDEAVRLLDACDAGARVTREVEPPRTRPPWAAGVELDPDRLGRPGAGGLARG